MLYGAVKVMERGGGTSKRERLKPPLSESADQITLLAFFSHKSTNSVLSLHYSGILCESEEDRPRLAYFD